jgi:ATPase family associated with various cellular activities (AAA)
LEHDDIDIGLERRALGAAVSLPISRLEGAELPRALFVRVVLGCGARVIVSARAERQGDVLTLGGVEELGESCQASVDEKGVREALLRCAPGQMPALLCRHHSGDFEVSVAAGEVDAAEAQAALLAAAIRVERKPRDTRVPVAFWAGAGEDLLSVGGPRWRRLSLPPLAEIADNYPIAVASGLTAFCAHSSGDALPGRLALWHGPPGTGKTWALRALGCEWRGWCDLHYITDPERLLGGDSAYMLKVLAGRSEADLSDRNEEVEDEPPSNERWRLLVLEDAGELLGLAAPAEVGRGFARLLNIADGLLGQGSRALILVTSNEPLGKLHPAALRPGRAMATLEFAPLSAAEAAAWFAGRGVDRKVGSSATIAELHAILAGGQSKPQAGGAAVGFE